MTDEELDRLQSLTEAATEGPWIWYGEDDSMVSLCTKEKEMESVVLDAVRCNSCYKTVKNDPSMLERFLCGFPNRADAVFITESRTAIPALIAEIRVLRERARNT